jgi:hypothetical protein
LELADNRKHRWISPGSRRQWKQEVAGPAELALRKQRGR